jgi:hypothetical protein
MEVADDDARVRDEGQREVRASEILLGRVITGYFFAARPGHGKKNRLTGVSDALSGSLS